MIIGIIGANGFVGKNLVKLFQKKFEVVKIIRKSKFSKVPKNIETIIHTANSSKKFESKKNPNKDYKESVKLTEKILEFFGDKEIILISSISVNNEKNNYSRNRKKCEELVLKKNKKNKIFRLPVLFNPDAKRGILYDLLKNKKIYLSKNTLINPITISQVCSYVLKNLKSKKKIHELGSKELITIDNLRKKINSKSNFCNYKIKLASKKNKKINYSLRPIINELINYKIKKNKF